MTDSIQSPIWRVHPDYLNLEVSDHGEFRSLPFTDAAGVRRKARDRRQTPDKDGYLTVKVAGRMRKAHQLVMETFVGPCPDGLQVLHRDSNRANNCRGNLHYGTPSENTLQTVAERTHPQARMINCKRGHPLVAPNLEKSALKHGKRRCLSCERATVWRRCNDSSIDVQALADRFYAQLA